MATDKERFNRFFHAMLDRGVYLAPAMYEAGFVSSAHSAAEIAATVTARARRFRPWPDPGGSFAGARRHRRFGAGWPRSTSCGF